MRGLWLLAALLASGCGSPLVDEGYRGALKFKLLGIPSQGASLSEVEADKNWIRASLFWTPGARNVTFDELVEQPSTSTGLELPWSFEWLIYDEPEPQHLFQLAGGGALGIAVPVLYADRNGNHRRDGDEPVYGRAAINLALFAPQDIPQAQSPFGAEVPKGYHLAGLPLDCAGALPSPATGSTDCGVPLGEKCTSDAECGPGRCLLEAGVPFPGGYCAVVEPPPSGCRPVGAVLWRPLRNMMQMGMMGMGMVSYWVKACSQHSDCRGDFPYQCDFGVGACLPTLHVLLQLDSDPVPPPICRQRMP